MGCLVFGPGLLEHAHAIVRGRPQNVKVWCFLCYVVTQPGAKVKVTVFTSLASCFLFPAHLHYHLSALGLFAWLPLKLLVLVASSLWPGAWDVHVLLVCPCLT